MLFVFLVGKVTLVNKWSSGFLVWGVKAKPHHHDHLRLSFSPAVPPPCWCLLMGCQALGQLLFKCTWELYVGRDPVVQGLLPSAQQRRGKHTERLKDLSKATQPNQWRLNLALFGSKVHLILTTGHECFSRKKCQHMVLKVWKISSNKSHCISSWNNCFHPTKWGSCCFSWHATQFSYKIQIIFDYNFGIWGPNYFELYNCKNNEAFTPDVLLLFSIC